MKMKLGFKFSYKRANIYNNKFLAEYLKHSILFKNQASTGAKII